MIETHRKEAEGNAPRPPTPLHPPDLFRSRRPVNMPAFQIRCRKGGGGGGTVSPATAWQQPFSLPPDSLKSRVAFVFQLALCAFLAHTHTYLSPSLPLTDPPLSLILSLFLPSSFSLPHPSFSPLSMAVKTLFDPSEPMVEQLTLNPPLSPVCARQTQHQTSAPPQLLLTLHSGDERNDSVTSHTTTAQLRYTSPAHLSIKTG